MRIKKAGPVKPLPLKAENKSEIVQKGKPITIIIVIVFSSWASRIVTNYKIQNCTYQVGLGEVKIMEDIV